MNLSVSPAKVHKSTPGKGADQDLLAVEEPLQIRLGYGPRSERNEVDLAVTMRTPGHDLELVAGFLLSERIVEKLHDIIHIDHCERIEKESEAGNVVRVELNEELFIDPDHFRRYSYSASSCGICGVSSIEQVTKQIKPITHQLEISSNVIHSLPRLLHDYQVAFNQTGGMHAAGLFDQRGKLLLCREDIGRHNTVDKVIGASFFKGDYPLINDILFLSGRAGFELIQKAAIAGIPMVASVGAPSNLAVQLAEEAGITLLGFVRDDNFNIYSGESNIK